MEQEMNKNWEFIKDVLVRFSNQTKNRPYLTKEMDEFEAKMKRAIREEKLKRILKVL